VGCDGNAGAAFELSEIYGSGKYGVPLNRSHSQSWLKEASHLGNVKAKSAMNELYFNRGRDIIDSEIVAVSVFGNVKKVPELRVSETSKVESGDTGEE